VFHPRLALIALACLAAIGLSQTATARDSLGIFADWGAFRDAETPRCYAIAKPAPTTSQREHKPFASIGTWPTRSIRNQVHFRLSRSLAANSNIQLSIGDRTFDLTGAGNNAWAKDRTMDAAIVSAMRSARRMIVRGRDRQNRRFSNTYDLERAATAMDAATVGCSQLGRSPQS
jgi:hypothetical protein